MKVTFAKPIVLLVLLALCLPLLAFNIAQVARLHGLYWPNLYQIAESAPFSTQHSTWQSGSAALMGCDLSTANLKLNNLSSAHQSIDIQRTKLTVALLQENLEDAWNQFKSINSNIDLSPPVAARLSAWLIQNKQIDPTNPDPDITNLFAQAAGISTRQHNLQWIGQTLYKWIGNKTPIGKAIAQQWNSHLTNQQSFASVCPSQHDLAQSQGSESTINDQAVKNLLPELTASSPITHLLIANDFETIDPVQGFAQGWTPVYMANGNPWNFGIFDVSMDNTQAFKGHHAIRIDGLYTEQKFGLEPTRAGLYSEEFQIAKDAVAIVSLAYKTSESVADKPIGIYISGIPEIQGDRMLPSSLNHWQRLTLAFWNPTNTPKKVRLNLRSFSTGTVWFDDFSIHEIRRADGQPIPPRDPIIDIRPAE